MSQHFLLSAKARTLSLAKVMRLTDDAAHDTFKAIRWAATEGEPFCPKCGCVALYSISTRKLWKCKACETQFSVTSGTIFASRKLPIRDILAAIAIFVNGAKGYSALQLSRDLDVQYKTAFVMAHKIREALSADLRGQLSGDVEVDGAYFGGYVKPANYKADRVDRRLAQHRTGKRQVVVVMREREGRALPFVARSEAAGVARVASTVSPGSTIFADEASSWDNLHARFLTKRINHSECYSDGEACTNMAESFFSRLRRAEIGVHHHIAGPYLNAYANEMAWRENNRPSLTASNIWRWLARRWRIRSAASGRGIGRGRRRVPILFHSEACEIAVVLPLVKTPMPYKMILCPGCVFNLMKPRASKLSLT